MPVPPLWDPIGGWTCLEVIRYPVSCSGLGMYTHRLTHPSMGRHHILHMRTHKEAGRVNLQPGAPVRTAPPDVSLSSGNCRNHGKEQELPRRKRRRKPVRLPRRMKRKGRKGTVRRSPRRATGTR